MSVAALYTTIYRGSEQFWGDFLSSVDAQTDRDFVLWIGIDGIPLEEVQGWVRRYVAIPVRLAQGRGSPAMVRHGALRQIVEEHDTVILVDSDDVLLPSRVSAAKTGLKGTDLVGCALELIDESGDALDGRFDPPSGIRLVDSLPYTNVFGFSNTAYRGEALRRCLEPNPEIKLMDWFLATRAWLFGYRLGFDHTPRMAYRQYSDNTAGVVGPFSPTRIAADMARVLHHYRLILRSNLDGAIPGRRQTLEEACTTLSAYMEVMNREPAALEAHARSLDFKGRVPTWWEWVTAPIHNS